MADFKVGDEVIVMSDAGQRLPATVTEERDWIDGMVRVKFAGGKDLYVDGHQILGYGPKKVTRA
jgi:hypothetical protein